MQKQVKIGFIFLMLYIICIFQCIFGEMQTIFVRLTLVEHKIMHNSLQQSGLNQSEGFSSYRKVLHVQLKDFLITCHDDAHLFCTKVLAGE